MDACFSPFYQLLVRCCGVLFALGLLVGCSNPPTDEQATTAVKKLLEEGGAAVGYALPAFAKIQSVKVSQCADAAPLDGQLCAVSVISEEVPLLGAMVVPVTLRFVKRSDGWKAFLN